jgi:tetratricopeptide (TPR) repeat protein
MDNWSSSQYEIDLTQTEPNKHDIAVELFSTLGFFGHRDLSYESTLYLESNHTRIETCVHIAELCFPISTIEDLYVVAYAYVWAGAKYRNEVIKYMGLYLENGGICEYTPTMIFDYHGYVEDQQLTFKAMAYIDLGQAYEHEYDFENAMTNYKVANQIAPYIVAAYCSVSRIYVECGDFKNALKFLEEAKKTKFYMISHDFSTVIDSAINNANNKQKRGYVYKPRKG